MFHSNRRSQRQKGQLGDASGSHTRRALPFRSLKARVSRRESDEIILSFLESLDCPEALSTWLLYIHGEHRQLVEQVIDFNGYNSVSSFRNAYAAKRLFSKCANLSTGIDKQNVAIDSAVMAEQRCARTNAWFKNYLDTGDVSPEHGALIHRVCDKVASILGPQYDGMFSDSGWSAGRSSSVSGDDVTPLIKYGARLDCTVSAIPMAMSVVGSSPHWGQAALKADGPCSILREGFELVRGNTLITVPKNAKTDRVICYEPHVNIRLQLSVGDFLKKRLLRCGVNLKDQSINQRRARFASRYGTLATVDLKSASDTMAIYPLLAVLPHEWFCLFDSLRSKYTLWPDGENRLNEKFSSMGNGFTFELESLLFFSICSAVCGDVSVFGDDIIIPTEFFDPVKDALDLFGFDLNTSKSFAHGPFRESCGYDGYLGCDVTPIYLRNLPKVAEDVLKFHNAIYSWCMSDPLADPKHREVMRGIRNVVPGFTGPFGYGDGHYHVDKPDDARRASHGLDGWWFKSIVWVYPRILEGICSEIGTFQSALGSNALCVALGPKRSREFLGTLRQPLNRSVRRERQIRAMVNFVWPSVNWYSS